jgi:hypothetical protein
MAKSEEWKLKKLEKAQIALIEGEQVIDSTTGVFRIRGAVIGERNGVVIVTDRRVILFTTKLGGYDVQDFAYGLLTSVDHTKGWIYGDLDLAAAGDRSHVTQIPKNEVERVARAIRERMALSHAAGRTAPASAPESTDTAEEIRKLAQLKDEGLLTEDEFAAKKKQLLGL